MAVKTSLNYYIKAGFPIKNKNLKAQNYKFNKSLNKTLTPDNSKQPVVLTENIFKTHFFLKNLTQREAVVLFKGIFVKKTEATDFFFF